MKFLVVLSLVLYLGFAYGATIDRSRRAIHCPSLQDIIDALDSNNAPKAVADVVFLATCLVLRLE
uniref:Uncharacterized protein n=1 Tax=Tetranychus urticae TaxID=32264 RepID=T1JT92_TETUR